MGFISYYCSTELKDAIPYILEEHGITIISQQQLYDEMEGYRHFDYKCLRGRSLVTIGGFYENEVDRWFFLINSNHSIFNFWCGDARLIDDIKQILLAHGAVCNYPTKDKNETADKGHS